MVNEYDMSGLTNVDVLVVGGGCTGCTVAIALAQKGRRVAVIERDLGYQDRIVGELLQPGGIQALERLGISDCAKENIDSVVVNGYVVIDPARAPNTNNENSMKEQILSYPNKSPESFSEQFGITNGNITNEDKRPTGRSFHHGKFVLKLREKARNHPNIRLIEGTASKLIEKDDKVVGVELKIKGGSDDISSSISLYAPLTIVADGIWSSCRSKLSDTTLTKSSHFIGLVVKHPPMQSPVPYPYHGHVILANPSPCLIYQISSTETRVLIDYLGDSLPSTSNGDMQEYLKTKVCPQLPVVFRESFLQAISESEIKSMPNRFCPAKSPLKLGAVLLGDALNMRHPLTGGGMTVAIRDAEHLANLLGDPHTVDLTDSIQIQKLYSGFLETRKSYASTINVLANALHSVFSAPQGNELRLTLRQACFDYLSMGGMYAAGPIGLLSGLTPRPTVLVMHFFMVAFFSMKNVVVEGVSVTSLTKMYNLLRVACTIILPLLASEKSTVLSWSAVRGLAQLVFPPIALIVE